MKRKGRQRLGGASDCSVSLGLVLPPPPSLASGLPSLATREMARAPDDRGREGGHPGAAGHWHVTMNDDESTS